MSNSLRKGACGVVMIALGILRLVIELKNSLRYKKSQSVNFGIFLLLTNFTKNTKTIKQ